MKAALFREALPRSVSLLRDFRIPRVALLWGTLPSKYSVSKTFSLRVTLFRETLPRNFYIKGS